MNVDKKLPPNYKHPDGTPEEPTEPKIIYYYKIKTSILDIMPVNFIYLIKSYY
jgi:hypothetical protein